MGSSPSKRHKTLEDEHAELKKELAALEANLEISRVKATALLDGLADLKERKAKSGQAEARLKRELPEAEQALAEGVPANQAEVAVAESGLEPLEQKAAAEAESFRALKADHAG